MSPPETRPAWWRDAVIYQVYPRSFADADGDGLGDLTGIRNHLPYIRDLGVDAIWINPWYPSPMADAGYDVADYRDIDPMFGTLSDAEALTADAHSLGLRVLLDIVPNHTSSAHPWFQAALAAGPGSRERRRYLFRPGRADGSQPPNDWESVFGGPAWTRIVEPDGSPGEWYLHLFDPAQPDLNWDDPEVRAEFESVLRFWFDRGVDGFRIDVANALHKEPDLPNLAGRPQRSVDEGADDHPFWDRDTVHEVYREWRRVADSYPDPRMFVAEAWVPTPDRLARYLRPGHLHSAFNFDFLATPWRVDFLRQGIDEALTALAVVGAKPTWVLSNHDVVRVVSRLGVPQPNLRRWRDIELDPSAEPDLRLGTQRARAAALLLLGLPGGAYVYQGEELGLWEMLDIPDAALQDPIWERSGRTRRGRDGARVPMPWTADGPSLGFGPSDGAPPWLPQPAAYAGVAVERQQGDPHSMLELYRRALRIRREHAGFGSGPLRWLESPEGVLAFEREAGLVVIVNVEGAAVELPEHRKILLASGPLDGSRVPPNAAVWLQT